MIAAELPAGVLRERRMRQASAMAERGEPEAPSLLHRLQLLPASVRRRVLDRVPPSGGAALASDWRMRARPTQLAPKDLDWAIWMILSGRSWGKTRTGAEWVRERIESGRAKSIAFIGASLGDVWKEMVYGSEAAPGIVRLFEYLPEQLRPVVKKQERLIQLPAWRAEIRIYTAEEPQVRGPNLDTIWCDELAKWRYLATIWDNIEMTRRAKGITPPRICITTTPRPLQVLRDLLDDPEVRVTFGSTFANSANVDAGWIRRMRRKYGSTRTGKQEIWGLLLDDNPDALFHASTIDAHRVPEAPKLVRRVVAVDPAVSSRAKSDWTGIVVLGLSEAGGIYVLADLTGVEFDRDAKGLRVIETAELRRHTPAEWAELVVRAYHFYDCNAIVGETNKIGENLENNIRAAGFHRAVKAGKAAPAADLASKAIRVVGVHSRDSKGLRADPVATLYDTGCVHHVGILPRLEDEMAEWNPSLTKVSPNRIDALVHGCVELAGITNDKQPDPHFAANAKGLTRALAPAAARVDLAALFPKPEWGSDVF